MALTVVTFGTVVSVGFRFHNAATVLAYPLLSLTFVVLWLHHTHRIVRIATYTRKIERRVGLDNLGWKHHVRSHPLPYRQFSYWGLRSVFLCTALVAFIEGTVMLKSFGLRTDAQRHLAAGRARRYVSDTVWGCRSAGGAVVEGRSEAGRAPRRSAAAVAAVAAAAAA